MILGVLDDFLDQITMYRLVLYYLIGLVIAAVGLAEFGDLSFSPFHILLSSGILVLACWAINKVFAWFLAVPSNSESTLITALILALIIPPMSSIYILNITFLLAASGLAIASKYLLTIGKRHLFNPAAIAVVLTTVGPKQSATWWVGVAALLPFVLIGGILVVRKLRRWRMVLSFFASSLLATVIYSLIGHGDILIALRQTITESALFFLGFVMLTEPATTPPTAAKQTWYGFLVGLLFPPQTHLGSFYTTPELALCIGNIYAYIVGPKERLVLHLRQKHQQTPDVVDFTFTPEQRLDYRPGQYMEWTLPHSHPDNRGVRRYLTLASSPTEPELRIGVKFYKAGSSYKRAMLNLGTNTPIIAGQLAGDFVLPDDTGQKLCFIAGGIGITPYRSMVKYLLDTKQTRSVSMIYAARTPRDFAYREIFESARRAFDMETTYVVSSQKDLPADAHVESGRITKELISKAVPDYRERLFYISGTHELVAAAETILRQLGLPGHRIKTDFFPGY